MDQIPDALHCIALIHISSLNTTTPEIEATAVTSQPDPKMPATPDPRDPIASRSGSNPSPHNNFQHLWETPITSESAGNAGPKANPGWYADHDSHVLRWWDGTAWSSHTAPLDAAPTRPQMRPSPSSHGHRPIDRSWATVAAVSIALILMALSLGAVFIALGQIVRGISTQGTYIRLGIFPFVAAACGFFLYVKSRTKARHDPLGPVAGRATHVRTLAIGSAGVLVAGAVFAGLALSSESKNSGTQDSTASGGAIHGNAIDGTAEDWLRAICAPGKFFDGTTIAGASSGATGGATCITTDSETIFILEYDSNFKMQNDLVAYHMRFYASSVDERGRITVFAVNNQNTGRALSPLESFGFTIRTIS